MSEYIALGQTTFSPFASSFTKSLKTSPPIITSAALCDPPCRSGATCVNGRCVRPQTPPPATSTPEDVSEDEDLFIDNGYEDGEDLYANGNGGGSNFLLYGGIALLLAVVAGGGYWWWMTRSKEEEE